MVVRSKQSVLRNPPGAHFTSAQHSKQQRNGDGKKSLLLRIRIVPLFQSWCTTAVSVVRHASVLSLITCWAAPLLLRVTTAVYPCRGELQKNALHRFVSVRVLSFELT